MAAFSIFRSTDGSAPTLSGTAGEFVNLLNKCLVDGYGAISPAGWAKNVSGNIANYRAPAGLRHYLRVDDTGTTGAYIWGYKTMSDVNTGTWCTPNIAQVTTGFLVTKSSAASGTTRPWIIFANNKICYIFINQNSSASNTYYASAFGEFPSYKSGDTTNTIVIGNYLHRYYFANQIPLIATQRCIIGKYDGLTSSSLSTLIPVSGLVQYGTAAQYMGRSTINGIKYPDPINTTLFLTGFYIAEYDGATVIRGWLPGIYCSCHLTTWTTGDTFTGSVGQVSGKTFEVINILDTDTTTCCIFIETSNTIYDVPIV